MKHFIQENRRILIVAALAILSGILIGFSIALHISGQKVEETAGTAGKFIAPTADIRAELTFSRCDHIIQIELDPEPYVGLSKEEFLAHFPDITISMFESGTITFEKQVFGVCGEHYLLVLDHSDQIAVQRFDEDMLDMKDVVSIAIPASMLEPLLHDELKSGVVFTDMDEVNAYLENAES